MSNQKSFKEILASEEFVSMIRKTGTIVLVIFLIGILASYYSNKKYVGEEVARLTVNELSASKSQAIYKDTALLLQSGDVIEVWSEMEIKYLDTFQLNYHIKTLKDGLTYSVLDINPLDRRRLLLEKSWSMFIFDKNSLSFKARCEQIDIPEDGTYTFSVSLVDVKSRELEIKKSELVLRYPPKKE